MKMAARIQAFRNSLGFSIKCSTSMPGYLYWFLFVTCLVYTDGTETDNFENSLSMYDSLSPFLYVHVSVLVVLSI
jgi:hypothetical protein